MMVREMEKVKMNVIMRATVRVTVVLKVKMRVWAKMMAIVKGLGERDGRVRKTM